jgi:hypothetical protein
MGPSAEPEFDAMFQPPRHVQRFRSGDLRRSGRGNREDEDGSEALCRTENTNLQLDVFWGGRPNITSKSRLAE